MAETHEEIFRSKIEITGPDAQAAIKNINSITEALQRMVQESRDIDLSALSGMTVPPDFVQNITRAAAGFGDLRQSIETGMAAVGQTIKEAASDTALYTQNVLKSAEASAKAAAENRRAAQEAKAAATARAVQTQALKNFEISMAGAEEQTRGFGAAHKISGDILLRTRVAFSGTAEAGGKMTQVLDVLRSAQERLTQETTKEERALQQQSQLYQRRSQQLSSAVDELGKYARSVGTAAGDTQQLTFAARAQMGTVRNTTNAIMANKRATDSNRASMKNANQVIRNTVKEYRTKLNALDKSDDKAKELAEQIEKLTEQQELELEVINNYAKAAEKSTKEREESTKAGKEQESVFKKLVGALNIFNRGQKQVSKESRVVKVTMDAARHSLFALTGAFTAAELAADALRAVFRKISEGIRTIQEEFLGMGIIKDMFEDLTTGVARFGAILHQQLIAATVVGKQMGFTADFVAKRMYQMREANIAASGALDLFIRTGAIDPVRLLGPLEGTAEGIQRVRDALAGTEGLSKYVRIFNDDFEDMIDGLDAGTVSFEDSTLGLFRMAAAIEDPIEQIKFLKTASDEGVLGMEAIARSAQNIAAATGKDTLDTLNAFTNAIQRGTTEAAEQYGIYENASQMTERWSEATGIATDDMDALQKSQAVMLGIVQTSIPYLEVYGEVYDTAGKQISSMRRYIENAKEAMSNLLAPALDLLLSKFKDFLIRIEEIASSDAAQRLADQFIRLAGHLEPVNFIIRAIVDNFESFARVITPLISGVVNLMEGDLSQAFFDFKYVAINAITNVALWFESFASNAVNWGYNLIINLSNGIIEAANTVLTYALQFVGELMALFFGPGSPPARGPLSKINEWGLGLIEELAGGMEAAAPRLTEAASAIGSALAGGLGQYFKDLSLEGFKGIKDAFGQIQGIFRTMVGTGAIQETDVAPGLLKMRDLLLELNLEFESTGEISEEVLQKIGDRLGDAGDDVEEYIRLQFELRSAQEDLLKVDEEIEAAEAAGFVPKALLDKKKAAKDRVGEVKDQLSLQKEIISWQQEGNNLAAQQIKLMERMAKAQEAMAKAATKGQKDQWEAFLETYNNELRVLEEKKRLGLITEDEYLRGRLALEQRYIDTALRLGKPLSEERIQFFKDLKAQLDALKGGKGKGGIEDAALSMAKLREQIEKANELALGWEKPKKIIRETSEEFNKMRRRVVGVFNEIAAFFRIPFTVHLKNIIDWIKKQLPQGFAEATQEIAADIEETIGGAFENVGKTATTALIAVGGAAIIGPPLLKALKPLIELLSYLVLVVRYHLQPVFAAFSKILSPVIAALKAVGVAIYSFLGPIGTAILVIGLLVGAFFLFREEIAGFTKIFEPIGDVIEEVLKRVYGVIKVLTENIARAISNFVERLSEMESLQRLVERLAPLVRGLATLVGVVLLGAISLISGILIAITAALDPLLDAFASAIDVIARFVTLVVDFILTPFKLIEAVISGDISILTDHFEQFADDVIFFLKGLGDFILSIPKWVYEVFKETTIGFAEGVLGIFTGNFGQVRDVFDALGKDIGEWFNNTLDKLGGFGDAVRGIGKSIGDFRNWVKGALDRSEGDVENYVEEVEYEFKSLSGGITNVFGAIVDTAKTGYGDMMAAAEEADVAEALIGAMALAGGEIAGLLEEQAEAHATYQDERIQLIKDKNWEELNELDKRYAKEDRMRKEAMAKSLLDLNNQIMQEKLMRKGLVGAEAAAIVAKHRTQAEQIAAHYGLPIEAAERMTDEAGTALRAAVLHNDEYLESMGTTFGEALTLFDELETEGYAGLEEASRESLNSLIIQLALLQVENEESFGAISETLTALPDTYEEMVLRMLGQGANLEEILSALEGLDRTFTPVVELELKYTKSASSGGLHRRSPKMELQHSLELLVEYAEDNPVEVLIELVGNTIEDILEVELSVESLYEAIESLADYAPEFTKEMVRAARDITTQFTRMARSLTRTTRNVKNDIIRAFRQLHLDVVALMRRLVTDSVRALTQLGPEGAKAISTSMTVMKNELQKFFIGGRYTGLDLKFFEWGSLMMDAFAKGIRHGKKHFVEDALKYVANQMPKKSPAETGPLAFEPNWDFITEGLVDQVDVIEQAMRAMKRLRDFQLRDPRMLQIAPTPAMGGRTFIDHIEIVLPNVVDADDAGQLIAVLDDLAYRSHVRGMIGVS